ncbi:MAG: hypothetical protein K2J65_02795 [Duncaniella sp.]|nr:hypothetical protein [Duncaniella sp.]
MKRLHILAVLLTAVILTATAGHNDPVLITVNGKEVHQSEFEYLYNKNRLQQIEPQCFDEYLDLFIVFKLKVADAEAAGIHTTSKFRNEFEGYCAELALPYKDAKSNPEYINLVNEYRDGMLLFEISDIKVWKPASTDKNGLSEFLRSHNGEYTTDSSAEATSMRSRIILDYQQELESRWVKELRTKYEVSINNELVDRLREKFQP